MLDNSKEQTMKFVTEEVGKVEDIKRALDLLIAELIEVGKFLDN